MLRASRMAVLALTVTALIAVAGIVAKRDELRLVARPTPPPPPLPVVADTRLLIFAPHPDDEVIAAGGLIQQAREAGGTVRVVYLIPECSLAPFKHRLKLFRIYDALAPNDDRLLVRTLSKGPTPCLSDPRILFAAKGAHIILDTAVRFAEGDENSATEMARGLANDIFALLGSGARSVIAAHHSPKPFARENTMRLENVLRGSGDVGAMLTTAWGVKQIDSASNILHIENIKPRDFQPCGPFQIIGRPFIDETGDFRILKRPGGCGSLSDEQEPERDRGGAPIQAREARAANIELLREWLREEPLFFCVVDLENAICGDAGGVSPRAGQW